MEKEPSEQKEGETPDEINEIIDFSKIMPRNGNEANFFRLLQSTKKAIYDWKTDEITVKDEDSTMYTIKGDDFYEIAQIPMFSPAQTVYQLELNGIEVKNVNWPEGTKEDKQTVSEFMQEVRDAVRRSKQ
jgi:hypothetical protein